MSETREWPNPTPEMLKDPTFNAIWNVIKSWDINVPDAYSGYCGATGNHVRAILDALPASIRAADEALPALLDLAERASLPLAGDVDGLCARLEEHATDWNGVQMPDAEPAKGDPTAGALRQAASLIRSLARALDEAKGPAAADVLAERERQKSSEGWTIEHDDAYHKNELPLAAACYAIYQPPGCDYSQRYLPNWRWPWSLAWWKPTNRRRDLVKAGALILAEIERIDRARAILEPGHEG